MSKTLVVKPDFLQSYRDGYPLISQESIKNWDKIVEGDILNLVDEKGRFIAIGYHGKQNRSWGWTLSNSKQNIDISFFKKRIESALSYREKLFNSKDTTAFRVFNGEGDGVGGLTIDYFDGYYLITWYSIGIYEHREKIVDALNVATSNRGIYQKRRFNAKGSYLDDSSDFISGTPAPTPLIVQESGVKFAIYLDDGAMVGVFLDQREVRKCIRDNYSKGKTFLNTFSYTGAFSIFASLGGATKTTSVDLANRSRAKTEEHFNINSIDIEVQSIIVEDVFKYFKYALKKELKFDIVLLDPPSFARSKKRTFSASKDYTNLLKDAIAITKKDGIIIASTNSANFSMMRFREFIATAFKESKKRYKVEKSFSLGEDFRVHPNYKEGDYLKVVFIRKL